MNQPGQKKVVLVTGGSRGIGKKIAETFKAHDWFVATCATQLNHLEATLADLKFQCDVADVESVKSAIQKTLNKWGRIDVIVNNAGLAGSNSLDPSDSDDLWHKIIDVNLNGTYYLCKYAAPHLPDGSGKIINIASVLAVKGVPDGSAYCAAKHAVVGLTRSLAHFLAPRKITVNAVCPGWVRTEMAVGRMKEIGITEKDIQKSVPLGRFIEPEEVADFVYYLAAAQGSSMITGQVLAIDGGTLC
jgi:NAD(P)-dependent dehydrogenase (short-subunit alcohol dehydrogenase family)